MAFLREAVEKQKGYLIRQLIDNGIVDKHNHGLHNKTISEIVRDYETFCIEYDKQYAFKFTRYDAERQEKKSMLH